MSRHIGTRFTALPGSQAGATGEGAGRLIADRPAGVAGGTGQGRNGGEPFAAALGGCFWNDLHYAAERLGARVGVAEVAVDLVLDGDPLRVTAAQVNARLTAEPPEKAREIFDLARAVSTIANSVMAAVPVGFAMEDEP